MRGHWEDLDVHSLGEKCVKTQSWPPSRQFNLITHTHKEEEEMWG